MDTIFLLEQTDLVNTLIRTLEINNHCVDINYEIDEDDEDEIPEVQIWWLVRPGFHDIIEELNITSFSYAGQCWFGQSWWGASLDAGLRYSGIFERLPFLND